MIHLLKGAKVPFNYLNNFNLVVVNAYFLELWPQKSIQDEFEEVGLAPATRRTSWTHFGRLPFPFLDVYFILTL